MGKQRSRKTDSKSSDTGNVTKRVGANKEQRISRDRSVPSRCPTITAGLSWAVSSERCLCLVDLCSRFFPNVMKKQKV
jgi:hypothetical protein